jgi:hypothetical protein
VVVCFGRFFNTKETNFLATFYHGLGDVFTSPSGHSDVFFSADLQSTYFEIQ